MSPFCSAGATYPTILSGSGFGELLLNVTIDTSVPVYSGTYRLNIEKINMPPISSRFSVNSNMSEKKRGYEYDLLGLIIPKNPNNFTVTANDVKNLTIGLRKYPYKWFDLPKKTGYEHTFKTSRIWITTLIPADKDFIAKTESDIVSPGAYDAILFGDAKENVTAINITITIIKKLIINGNFSLLINTTGFPEGNYFINAKATNGSFKLDELDLGN